MNIITTNQENKADLIAEACKELSKLGGSYDGRIRTIPQEIHDKVIQKAHEIGIKPIVLERIVFTPDFIKRVYNPEIPNKHKFAPKTTNKPAKIRRSERDFKVKNPKAFHDMVNMIKQGAKMKEVSKRYGITDSAIYLLFKKYGISIKDLRKGVV